MKKEEVELLLKHKDDSVKTLAKEYMHIMTSPYYDTYITMFNQLRNWNEQLKIGDEETIMVGSVEAKTQKGKIDLFADKDTKDFDRAFKYFSDVVSLCDALEKMKSKLTPEESQRMTEETTGASYEGARKIALGK